MYHIGKKSQLSDCVCLHIWPPSQAVRVIKEWVNGQKKECFLSMADWLIIHTGYIRLSSLDDWPDVSRVGVLVLGGFCWRHGFGVRLWAGWKNLNQEEVSFRSMSDTQVTPYATLAEDSTVPWPIACTMMVLTRVFMWGRHALYEICEIGCHFKVCSRNLFPMVVSYLQYMV